MQTRRNQTYEERKLAERCTRCGRKRLAADSLLCASCLTYQLARKRQTAKRRRSKRGRKGRCAECPRKSKAYRCPACTVRHKLRRARPSPRMGLGVVAGVEHKRKRIAERTQIVAGGHGRDFGRRTRYRGGHLENHRPSNAHLDEQDYVAALDEAARGFAGLALMRTPAYASLPRMQRRSGEEEALAHIDLARRLFGDVLERNHYPIAEAVEDGDEEP